MPGKALFHSVFAEASALQQCLGRSPLLWRIPDVKPNFSISRIFLEGKKKGTATRSSEVVKLLRSFSAALRTFHVWAATCCIKRDILGN